jgi:lauroyl/myristoyl acyltransferase
MYRVSGKDVYFPFVIGLLTICRRLPIWLREVIVQTIALTAYLLSGRKRRLTLHALDVAFGDALGASQKRDIAKGAFYHFWRETFWMAASVAEREQIGRISLRGDEHLRSALSRGKGVILLESSCFGSRVLARRVLCARGYALRQVHARNHLGSGFVVDLRQWNWAARWLSRFFEACEMEFVTELIYLPTSDSLAFTRLLLDRLKGNSSICIAVDGKRSQRLIGLPFLGFEESFSTGLINLARTSGAAVLPLFCVRQSNAEPEVIIESAIDVESASGREASLIAGVHQCASLLERYCRMYPGQYYAWSTIALNKPAS